MLAKVTENLKVQKNMDLKIDPTVIRYLEENGYSVELGARPLKKLIEKKVVGAIAKAIVRESIPDGSHLTIKYDSKGDIWSVIWE